MQENYIIEKGIQNSLFF
ncbi:hypothetical protein PT138_04515 (plasmid) [Borreliella garinii]|nr:hypothetical protein PT138_04515 [Borreliella garinii]